MTPAKQRSSRSQKPALQEATEAIRTLRDMNRLQASLIDQLARTVERMRPPRIAPPPEGKGAS